MKRFILFGFTMFALAAFLFGAMTIAGGYLSDDGTIWNAQRPAVEMELFALNPGVFTGTGGGGFYGNVSVAITVDDAGIITNIEVVYSRETEDFSGPAFAYLTGSVLAAQTAYVDVFSGATLSSNAFLNAVHDAMRISSGGMLAAQEDAAAPVPEGTVYIGTGTGGYYGDVVVAVTIGEGGVIVHIEVIEHVETPGIANPAFAQLITSVLSAQSADVDIIADATFSSAAFLDAVRDALNQAQSEELL